jgi:metallo-beta-lactamase class B
VEPLQLNASFIKRPVLSVLRILTVLSILVGSEPALADEATSFAATRAQWNQPAEPFRVIGNIYYVGTDELAAWLVTTPDGYFLLDGGLPESAPLIEANIRKLGFRLADIKFLLNSHAHFDHSGGLAELKQDTGAQLIASAGDQESLETGTYLGSEHVIELSAPPVKVDQLAADGQEFQLGSVAMTAHLTPGHTRGCTTWTTRVLDMGMPHTVVFYCSTSVALNRLAPTEQYPGITADYQRSFGQLVHLSADVFLANHKDFFNLWPKRETQKRGGTNPFINATEFHDFVLGSRLEFEQELRRQQGVEQ